MITANNLLSLFSQGHFSKVISEGARAGFTPGMNPDESRVIAAAHFRNGSYTECVSILEELESVYNSQADFYSLFGAAHRRLGNLDKAETIFKKALSIDPNDIALQNNYANLLIDIGRHDDAFQILTELASKNPDYQDAIENLNRVKALLNSSDTSTNSSQEPISQSDNAFESIQLDPLSKAFSDEEVRLHGRIKRSSVPSPLRNALPTPNNRKIALDKLKLAKASVSENNPNFALQLCSEALSLMGSHGAIYDCASDAYIALKKYDLAESCILHASTLSELTVIHCINLVSICCIRGDLSLAKIYFEKANALDPSCEHLEAAKKTLLARLNSSKSSFDFTSKL